MVPSFALHIIEMQFKRYQKGEFCFGQPYIDTMLSRAELLSTLNDFAAGLIDRAIFCNAVLAVLKIQLYKGAIDIERFKKLYMKEFKNMELSLLLGEAQYEAKYYSKVTDFSSKFEELLNELNF